jgi:signal transduction histidine kinase
MSSGSRSPVRQTVAFRLALWYVAVFAVATTTIGLLTYALLSRSLEERDRELVRGTLVACAGRWEVAGLAGVRALLAERDRTGAKGEVFVRVLDGTLDVLFLSAPPGWTDVPPARADIPPPGSGVTWGRLKSARGDTDFEVASVALADGSFLQAGRSTEQREELLARYRGVLVPAGLAVLLAGVAGGAILTHAALRPLRLLNEAVRRTVETGRLDARVPTRETGDPLDELGAAFNALLAKISVLVTAMRGSLDDVAHDLRTPLARLRAVAEQALRSPDDPAVLREGLGGALEQAERVSSLLDEMMDVAEAESGAMRLSLGRVAAGILLGQAVDLFADAAEEKGIDLDMEAEADLVLAVDAARMRQVLANLLDNALKYTRGGGRVRLRARAEGDAALLEVEDSGIGIPPEDLPRVFDRLYRGDRSRSERGLGLGLALVRAIVTAHGGTVSVESEPGRGALFTVRLPDAVRT